MAHKKKPNIGIFPPDVGKNLLEARIIGVFLQREKMKEHLQNMSNL